MPRTGIAKRSSTSPETDLDMELSLFRDIIANNTSVDLRLSINDFSYLVLKTFPWFEAVLFPACCWCRTPCQGNLAEVLIN